MDIRIIANHIKKKQCILFIGPKLLECEDEGVLTEMQTLIADYLRASSNNLSYYKQDELFLFHKENERGEIHFLLKTFLEEQKIEPSFYQKMMEIPFPLIVNFSPYLNPQQNFPKMNIPYPFDYEYYHKRPSVITELNEHATDCWFFDLFGNIEEAESVMLTHTDLFDYVSAILGAKPLHTHFKKQIQDARCFLFLGFSFEKWYVKLLIRVLREIHYLGNKDTFPLWRAVKELEMKTVEDAAQTLENTTTFYQSALDFKFISEISTSKEFIEQLNAECKKLDLLRVPPEQTKGEETFLEQINSFLKKDKLEELLSIIEKHFKKREQDISETAFLLLSRLNRNTKDFDNQEKTKEEYMVERNRILRGIQRLIKEVEEYE